jgi:hypothetical protein
MNPRQVVLGVLIIGVGVVFLLGRLQGGLEWSWHRLWPILPLLIGVTKMLVPGDDRSRTGPMWLMLVGVVFLLHNYRVVTIDDSWPVFVVGLGVSILMGRGDRQRATRSGS